jgi:type II secretory pathway component PulF
MAEALARLATFLEEQEKLREKLLTSLLYPAVVVALAAIVGGLVLTLLLPMMLRLLTEANLALPALTKITLVGGRAVGGALVLLAAGGALAPPASRAAAGGRNAAPPRDRFLFAVPLRGAGWRNLASLRFVRVWGCCSSAAWA